MGDIVNDTFVQVNPDGTVSYVFEGTIVAQGVDLQATSSDTAPGVTALIRWLDANNVDVADLFGNLNAGVSELLLRALITADSTEAIAQLVAVDPNNPVGLQAVLGATLDPSASVGSRAMLAAYVQYVAGGAFSRLGRRIILDDAGKSDFSSTVFRDTGAAHINNTLAETFIWGTRAAGNLNPLLPLRSIPGHALGIDRTARLRLALTALDNTGGGATLTVRVYWAGVLLLPAIAIALATSATRRRLDIDVDLANQQAANAQYGRVRALLGAANIGAAPSASSSEVFGGAYAAVDTTQNQDLEVSVQWNVQNISADVFLESATLEIA